MPRRASLTATLPPQLVAWEAAAAYVCVAPKTFDHLADWNVMPKARVLGALRSGTVF
jgi:hypothetical protein